VPNCKSFLFTEAERKHVRRRTRFQQHRDVSCHQVISPCKTRPERNSRHSERNIRGTTPSYVTVKSWVTLFIRGDFSTCDARRSGRPKTVTTPEIINQIYEPILKDRRISAISITEHLDISREGKKPR